MRTFEYRIQDELGIHARPAGMLVKVAKEYDSKITLTKDGKSVECTKLMGLMGLGVKCGNTVTIAIEGSDEEAAEKGIREFLEGNL